MVEKIDEVLDVDLKVSMQNTPERKWNIFNLIYGFIHMSNSNLKDQHIRLQQTQDTLSYNYFLLYHAVIDFLKELEMFGGYVRRGELDNSPERPNEIRDRLSRIYNTRLGNLKK